MLVDIICLLLLVMAIFKGVSQGFIVALFSLASFIIGLAAATKLSAVVAGYLRENMHLQGYWIAVLSFLLVFAGVVLLVRWASALIKKAISIAFLGWADGLAGIVLYAVIYLMVFSIVLFYAAQIHLIPAGTIAASKTYPVISPFGPKVLDALGAIIPLFKNMFSDLQHFFGGISQDAEHR